MCSRCGTVRGEGGGDPYGAGAGELVPGPVPRDASGRPLGLSLPAGDPGQALGLRAFAALSGGRFPPLLREGRARDAPIRGPDGFGASPDSAQADADPTAARLAALARLEALAREITSSLAGKEHLPGVGSAAAARAGVGDRAAALAALGLERAWSAAAAQGRGRGNDAARGASAEAQRPCEENDKGGEWTGDDFGGDGDPGEESEEPGTSRSRTSTRDPSSRRGGSPEPGGPSLDAGEGRGSSTCSPAALPVPARAPPRAALAAAGAVAAWREWSLSYHGGVEEAPYEIERRSGREAGAVARSGAAGGPGARGVGGVGSGSAPGAGMDVGMGPVQAPPACPPESLSVLIREAARLAGSTPRAVRAGLAALAPGVAPGALAAATASGLLPGMCRAAERAGLGSGSGGSGRGGSLASGNGRRGKDSAPPLLSCARLVSAWLDRRRVALNAAPRTRAALAVRLSLASLARRNGETPPPPETLANILGAPPAALQRAAAQAKQAVCLDAKTTLPYEIPAKDAEGHAVTVARLARALEGR